MLIKIAGFSLIELVISLLLLSFILLGLAGVEIEAIRQAQATYLFNVSVNQLINITERLMLFQQSADRESAVIQWNVENKNLLPNGLGQVEGGFPHYTLTLYWGNNTDRCNQTHFGELGCIEEKL